MVETMLEEIESILRKKWERYERELGELERARRGIGSEKRRKIVKTLMDYINEDCIPYNPS
jgi:uncharacterized FAD-dependent dehydrogenase